MSFTCPGSGPFVRITYMTCIAIGQRGHSSQMSHTDERRVEDLNIILVGRKSC